MSHGLPIISTPFRFAVELLSSDRGVIIPYNNDSEALAAFLKVISNEKERHEMGQKAQQFVSNWSWNNVAQEYSKLLLTNNSLTPITPDPFEKNTFDESRACWTTDLIQGFYTLNSRI